MRQELLEWKDSSKKIGIYAHEGQKYEPVDSEQLSFYREDKKGQVLEEGITEAGAMSSWIAAGTAYTNHDLEMVPVYTFFIPCLASKE